MLLSIWLWLVDRIELRTSLNSITLAFKKDTGVESYLDQTG